MLAACFPVSGRLGASRRVPTSRRSCEELPAVAMFYLVQRFLVGGLTAGGTKG